MELNLSGLSSSMSDFIETAESQFTDINDSLLYAKEQLLSTLHFFGERLPMDGELLEPEIFFSKVGKFCGKLEMALAAVNL
ncbi:hypothetical protein AB6A40_008747 [Gnathostoma spinigerum]|uniref:Uncharacterized protein n=1 Tax=Gnathostoma spinigerum TaxID=75299 RepID=A0ABD6EQA6_9BILA